MCRFSLANSVYKSLQDNNEDQAIICLGESASGKSENCRMIIKFLSSISGKRVVQVLQRQRSSNSIASFKNSPKSNCSTPKHKPSATIQPVTSKSSCIKSTVSSSQEGMTKSKKMSRVEFDFSYQKCNNTLPHHQDIVRYCPKHNCCSSSSSTTSTTIPIDIPPMLPRFDESPSGLSKSFTIYETMNRNHRSSLPNCHSKSARCESLTNITVTPPPSNKSTQVQCEPPTCPPKNINLDNFKSAKRKVPITNIQLSNIEIQAMKEKIAQAEVFLEAMGNASTTKNHDSSRYV